MTNTTSSATSIVATLTVRAPLNLLWTGQSSFDWDYATFNWTDTASSTSTNYSTGDHVRFDNSGVGSGFVSLTAQLSPSSVTVDSDSDYDFLSLTGGRLTGTSQLTKSGAGKLILEMDNNYTGPTTINAGTLQLGLSLTVGAGSMGQGPVTNNGAIVFSRNGATAINGNLSGTGTLTLNGNVAVTISGTNTMSGDLTLNTGSVSLTTPQAHGNFTNVTVNAGNGTAGTRFAISSGMTFDANVSLSCLNTTTGIRTAFAATSGTNTWNGPITVSGTDACQIYSEGSTTWLNINGNIAGENLNGAGSLLLRGSGSGTISGIINAPNAAVNITDNSTWILASTGNAWTTNTVAAGTLRMGANNALPANSVTRLAQGGTSTGILDLNGFNQQIGGLADNVGGNEIITNTAATDATLTLNTAAPWSFGGSIQSSASGGKINLTLDGGGTLTLRSNNTFNGTTTITSGTLALSGVGAIPNSAIISLASGTTLDVSARTTALTLGANQKLKGNGAFNVNGNLVNNGTIELKLNKSGVTLSSDNINGLNQITYGGTLSLVASGDALTTSDSFKLFTATTYTGAFVLISPSAPAAGLSWDIGTLATDGTLRIKSGPNQTPTNIVATISGNVLTLAWPEDRTGFRLQAQTNAINVGISTNWFDVTGSTSTNKFNATINPTHGTVFYRLVYP